MVAVHPQIYATVLVGQRNLLLEGLAHILDKTEFQIVARAASVDRLTPADMQEHKSVLLLLDAGPDVDTAIRQVQSFKQLHAAAHIAVVIGLCHRPIWLCCFMPALTSALPKAPP